MSFDSIERVYIIGAGALGGLYASRLYTMNPASVRFIADQARARSLQEKGLQVNGDHFHIDCITPGTTQPAAHLVLVAVKAPQLQEAIASLQGLVNKDTIILSLLNGISSERILGDAFHPHQILPAYAVGMDAVREDGAIHYTQPGRIVFGEARNDHYSPRVAAIHQLFDKAGIPHEIPVNMEKALWSKFMLNVGINQASAILNAPYGAFQTNAYAVDLLTAAAREVILLSQQNGIGLEETDLQQMLSIVRTLGPAGKTSMLQDMEAGRPTEVDLFAGEVIRLGKEWGIATPVNELIYTIIKAREDAI